MVGDNSLKKLGGEEGEQFNSGQSYIFLTISITVQKFTVTLKKIKKM